MLATNETHPLRIDAVQAPGLPGRLGLTLCPGKFQRNGGTVIWSRDLKTDVAAIEEWGAALVVSLITDMELSRLQVKRLPDELEAAGISWLHLPIHDGTPPGPELVREWPARSADILARLGRGENVLVHCKGGLGRAGTVAAMLLMDAGVPVDQAIHDVRAARPGAIETLGQERFLRQRAQRLSEA